MYSFSTAQTEKKMWLENIRENNRAVARSENPGGHVILGGDNVPPLVEIGLTDLPKSGGARARPAPPLALGLHCNSINLRSTFKL